MNKESILSELQSLFQDHFQNDQLLLSPTTRQGDIPKWDSLNHAILIEKIETQYAIKFDLMDMIGMQNVGDICYKILAKQDS